MVCFVYSLIEVILDVDVRFVFVVILFSTARSIRRFR